jgi:hypothetical protein
MNHTNARATSSGNPRRDGRDNTKEKRPLRIANRNIKFPDPDTCTKPVDKEQRSQVVRDRRSVFNIRVRQERKTVFVDVNILNI